MPDATAWFLYLIECRNGAYYAGISNDVERRYAAHCAGRGAKYTRANPPVKLIGARAYPDRSAAAKAEHAIRRLPRAEKVAFMAEVLFRGFESHSNALGLRPHRDEKAFE